MSSSLLSRRLKELEHAGIIERRPLDAGRGSEYHLSKAGRELFPIVEGMGLWAQRWVRDDLVADENLDPDLLMWDIRRGITTDGMPSDRRLVVCFQFSGVPVKRRFYWLVLDHGEVDLCLKNPGFEVDLYVSSHVKTLTEIWLGHSSLSAALRDERVRLDGSSKDIKAFRSWFAGSVFAAAGRQPPGQAD